MQDDETDPDAPAARCPGCCGAWPEVMTAHEVAAYLRLTYLHVLQLSREGGLPGWKVGRLWRYSKARLDAALAAGTAPQAAPSTS
ncbi:excisionase family DNA-binding protein [Kitasatospora aburaviensis]|uniref:Excisionase family DNA-binding protein n=1 Tax=Kitasatospora aburaviensis TaxID=67265 RepID=A0ABW1F648_9ACTN